MSVSHIFLVIISGLGVIHGLFLAAYLWIYPKGNPTSNKILSLLLVVLSFRIGKSVFLEFAEDLDVKMIFIGLSTLMSIGPLFYFYVLSYIDKTWQFKRRHLIHFVPTLVGMCFGFWVSDDILETFPMVFFAMLFLTYYGHYLTYLIISYRHISRGKKAGLNPDTYALLRLLFFALLAIWMAYVLNLFDEIIPYIVGPILYTVVAYGISFIVIRKGYISATDETKYKTTPIADEQVDLLFDKVLVRVVEEKQFKNENLTLKSLSEALGVSTQVLSLVINKQSGMNFNRFVNHHRVEESIRLFQRVKHAHHTIAAIAFEVGFNSISSFNTAFKKQTGKTPLIFRKDLTK